VTTKKVLLVLLTAGAVAAIAVGTMVVEDRQERTRLTQPLERRAGYRERTPLIQPLERRAGYREFKRACLDQGDDRRGARAGSCWAWQEMLAQERQRLALEEPVADRPVASAPGPR
jgi:hypothetical protein